MPRTARLRPLLLPIFALALLASGPVETVRAQEPPKLNFLDNLPFTPGVAGGDVSLSGEYKMAKGGRDGKLTITATVDAGWHLYSITQLPGGPQKTEIHVAASEQYTLQGEFLSTPAPEIKKYDVYDVPVEEHSGSVTWTAPFRVSENADIENLSFDVKLDGQICQESGSCIPFSDREVPIAFAGFYEEVQSVIEFVAKNSHVTVRGELASSQVAPGETIVLRITADPQPGWHVYAIADKDPEIVSKPTLIAWKQNEGWPTSTPQPSSAPTLDETAEDIVSQQYHESPVTWTVELSVPKDASLGSHRLIGAIGYQACTKERCELPRAAQFVAEIEVVDQPTDSSPASLTFIPTDYADVASLAASQASPTPEATQTSETPKLDLDSVTARAEPGKNQSMFVVLAIAFFGGLILNFMPCVLPVIGLKVMSFVQQAGESRRRVMVLNLWYVAGLISVFMVLATLAVVFRQAWASQFNNTTFNIVLTAVVFAFAVSFLGVWEIPVPGFSSGNKMGDLSEKEGPVGAFFKGILTTILATPCTGPALGGALTWAVNQPPLVTYTTFFAVGFGMAFPFIMIGAFPKLVGFLPKPGAWMETFKQVMGFVLLGTVVMLLTFIQPSYYVIPLISLLIGLWAGLWWVGRVPIYEPWTKQLRGWAEGTAFVALVWWISFVNVPVFMPTGLLGVMEGRFHEDVDYEVDRLMSSIGESNAQPTREGKGPELSWRPYSIELLQQLTSESKTVFIDFTANT